MKKFLLAAASAAAFALSPAMADPETKGPHTLDIKGCMMELDCTDGVDMVVSASQLQEMFPDYDWSPVANELDDILTSLESVDIPTFIADALDLYVVLPARRLARYAGLHGRRKQ